MTANPYDRPDTCKCSAWNSGECACGGYVDRTQVRAWDEGYAAATRDAETQREQELALIDAAGITWQSRARRLASRLREAESSTAATLEPPAEPGHVAFEVEVIPHDWPNDGMGWHKGRDTPKRVAALLREYADQVELAFTPPNPPPPPTEAEMQARLAEKFRKEGR